MEIPCPACPTWSHFIQDKLEISIYFVLGQVFKFIQFGTSNWINHFKHAWCLENSADPDQLASSEAS